MLAAAPSFMSEYIVFYSTEHATKFDSVDLPTAESRARILVAQQGPRTKLLCVRQAGAIGPTCDVPNPERSAKLRQGRVKPPEFK